MTVTAVENWELSGEGSLFVDWVESFPRRFRLKSSLASTRYPSTDDSVILKIGKRRFEAWIEDYDYTKDKPIISGYIIDPVASMGRGILVDQVKFHIPNLEQMRGIPIRHGEDFSNGRVVLKAGFWSIELDPIPLPKGALAKAKRNKGNLLTYVGILKRSSGGTFHVSSRLRFLKDFGSLLSFYRGRRTGVGFIQGLREGKIVYEDWSVPSTDPLATSEQKAIPISILNALQTVFPKFTAIIANPTLRKEWVILTSLFIESLHGSIVEKQLIMGQAALEALAWKLDYPQSGLTRKQYKDLSAANKITELIKIIDLPDHVPTKFKNLYAIRRQVDLNPKLGRNGPIVVVWVRNRFMHMRDEMGRRKIHIQAQVEAVYLMSHYLHQALLYLLNYRGKYHSICPTPFKFSTVPWVKSTIT